MGGPSWVIPTWVARLTRYELWRARFTTRGYVRCLRGGFGRSLISSIAAFIAFLRR